MKIIDSEWISSMKGLLRKTRVPGMQYRWHEGTEALGYWPEGDSVIFRAEGHYFAITKPYLQLIASDTFDLESSLARMLA